MSDGLAAMDLPDWVTRVCRENVGYLLGLGALVAILAWLTGSDPPVLVTVAATGLAYLAVKEWPKVSRRTEEHLVFGIIVVGVFLLLAFLSRTSGFYFSWSFSYLVFISVTVLIFALFALGLNLEYGYAGIINFGHVAFMGIGAYTTTLLGRRWLPRVEDVAGASVLDGLTTGSLLALGLLLLSLVLVFLVAAVLLNVATERLLRRITPRDGAARRRLGIRVGAGGGLAAALVLLLVVGYPLSPLWAQAYLVGTTVVLGMVLAALVGVLLGLPTLRLREDYLAIVTIGAAEIMRRIWLNETWLTDGPRGVVGFPLPLDEATRAWGWVGEVAGFLELSNPYKLLILLLVAGSLVFVYVSYEILVSAPYGRVLKAIREDEEVATALGKNVFVYKLQALALGSAVAGLAGSFIAWQNVYINPQTFLPLFTFYAWIIIVLGGIGNNRGTILGALILWTFFEATRFLNLDENLGFSSTQGAAFRIVLIGVLLILFMMFKPEGILGRREEMVLGD